MPDIFKDVTVDNSKKKSEAIDIFKGVTVDQEEEKDIFSDVTIGDPTTEEEVFALPEFYDGKPVVFDEPMADDIMFTPSPGGSPVEQPEVEPAPQQRGKSWMPDWVKYETFKDAPFIPYELKGTSIQDRRKEMPKALAETAVGLSQGALAWIPSYIAKFGQVLLHETARGYAIDTINNPQRSTPENVALAKKVLEKSPEDIQELGRASEELIASYFGTGIAPTTDSAKRIMNLVGKGLHEGLTPARVIANAVPEEYPNVRDFVQFVGELGMFGLAGKAGKAFKRKSKAATRLIKEEKFVEAEKATQDAMAELMKKPELMKKHAIAKEGLNAIESSSEYAPIRRMSSAQIEKMRELGKGYEVRKIREQLGKEQETAEFTKAIEKAAREAEGGVSEVAPKRAFAPSQDVGETILKPEIIPEVGKQKGAMAPIRKFLKSEKGELRIEKLTEAEKAAIHTWAEEAGIRGVGLEKHLLERNMIPKEARNIARLHKELKEERIETADPFAPREDEIRVNNDKGATKEITIGSDFMEALQKTPKLKGLEGAPTRIKAVTPSIYTFEALPKPIQKIYRKYIKNRKLKYEAKKTLGGRIKEYDKQFPNKKLRKEVTVRSHSRTKTGVEAMKQHGKELITGDIKYDALEFATEAEFKNIYNQINTMRKNNGIKMLPPIEELTGGEHRYMPFFANESFFGKVSDSLKGEKTSKGNRINLVTDDLEMIKGRHNPAAVKHTMFSHTKRIGLSPGTKLEFDPLRLLARYGDTAYNHIYISPITSLIKEITGQRLTNPKTGESFRLQQKNENLYNFLTGWSNSIAGISNWIPPKEFKWIEKGAKGLSKNLTDATLPFNLRTMVVQLAALINPISEFGILPTARGMTEVAFSKGVKGAEAAMVKAGVMSKRTAKKDRMLPTVEESEVLAPRRLDAAIVDDIMGAVGTPLEKARQGYRTVGYAGMKTLDALAAEVSFRTSVNRLKEPFKKGELTRTEVLNMSDDAVTRHHASGAAGDISPIQRNALTGAMSLWQTYTINNMNHVAKNVLGIKNPDLKSPDVIARVGRYVLASALVSSLFKSQDMESPQPAPIDAMIESIGKGDQAAIVALKTMMESSEILSHVGGLKYGSSPIGAVPQFIVDFTKAVSGNDLFYKDILPKALDGDPAAKRRLYLFLLDYGGRAAGVKGSKPLAKYIKGRDRGEPHVRAALGSYVEEEKGGTSGGRSSRKGRSSRRSRRRDRR